MGTPRGETPRAAAGRIVLAYLIGGIVFVVLSDFVLRQLAEIDQARLRLASRLAFLAISGIFLAVVIGVELTRRRRAELELARVDQGLSSLSLVHQSLAEGHEQELLNDLLSQVRAVLGADGVTILAFDRSAPHSRVLMVRGTQGQLSPGNQSAEPPAESGFDQVLRSRLPLLDPDIGGWADRSLVHADARSLIAQPLVARGEVIGLVYAASTRTGRFRPDELRLLGLIADRMASAIEQRRLFEAERQARLEAEDATMQLSLVADAGRMLGLALEDVEAAMIGLSEVLVPDFADVAVVGTLDEDGQFEELVVQVSDMTSRDAVRDLWQDSQWIRHVDEAMDAPGARVARHDRLAHGHPFRAKLESLDLDGMVVAPIRAPGHTFGVLACLRRSGRGDFSRSDVSTLDDLAGRAARTVEAVNLYRDTQEAARSAVHRAEQLRRLTDAAAAITAAKSSDELAHVLAEQACEVMQADGARVVLFGVIRKLVDVGQFSASDPLVVHLSGEVEGTVSVSRNDDRPFDANDRSILVSLAQLGSVAIAHAVLYQILQQEKNRISAVVEASPLGIVEVDRTGAILEANPAAADLFGWHGDPLSRDFPPALAAEVDTILRRPRTDEPILDRVVPVHRGDGREASLVVYASPLPGPAGDLDRLVLVVSDQTERRDLETQLRQAQSMEVVGKLAGNVSHDFNNLLTVILGYTDLIAKKIPEAQRADLDAVRAAAEQAATMTDRLLTLSRRRVVQPVVLALRDVIEEQMPVLQGVVGDNIELVFDHEHEVGNVLIDPGQLEQVLLNLVVNARDAMPRGGRLVVATDLTTSFSKGQDGAVIRVTDTGIGMDAATRERVFEPFFSTKARHGTGLGLSIVEGIVTQAGGRIEIESIEGQGTTFTITFPTVAAPAAEVSDDEQPTEGDDTKAGIGLKVLLVEDDDDIRSFAETVLSAEGYDVALAGNGAEALSIIEMDGPPDLVVTDVVMPKMSGIELARALRERFREMPILFMSGFAAEDGLEMGSAFLSKPFRWRELVAAVGSLHDEGDEGDEGDEDEVGGFDAAEPDSGGSATEAPPAASQGSNR